MRLTDTQISVIKQTACEVYGDSVRVWLFGSRVDDNKRGGDIDLLVCPEDEGQQGAFERRLRMLGKLERALGERKIDLVVEAPGDTRPIIRVAHETGIELQ